MDDLNDDAAKLKALTNAARDVLETRTARNDETLRRAVKAAIVHSSKATQKEGE